MSDEKYLRWLRAFILILVVFGIIGFIFEKSNIMLYGLLTAVIVILNDIWRIQIEAHQKLDTET